MQTQVNAPFELQEEERRKPASSGLWNGNPRHLDDLDISPADDGYMIYRPEQDRLTFLNSTAALILELCSGENSPEQIADLLMKAYSLPEAPLSDVRDTLKQLRAEGLLQ